MTSCRRIDFDMVLERLPDPKGDRVKITMSCKFLSFKYYRASGNVLAVATNQFFLSKKISKA